MAGPVQLRARKQTGSYAHLLKLVLLLLDFCWDVLQVPQDFVQLLEIVSVLNDPGVNGRQNLSAIAGEVERLVG